jgi:hypothetical protein
MRCGRLEKVWMKSREVLITIQCQMDVENRVNVDGVG